MIDPSYKLVRDHIPDMIKDDGGVVVYREASEEEYREYLMAKLDEEVEELKQSLAVGTVENIEDEMADVYEVLASIMTMRGTHHVIDLARNKRDDRGGFSKRYLLKVDKPNNT